MRSLRVRLFLVAVISIAAALTVVALLTRQVAQMEFHRFELLDRNARVEAAAQTLAARLAREPRSAALDAVLEELGRSVRHGLVLIGPQGELLSASTTELRATAVRMQPGGRIVLDQEIRRGPIAERRRMLLTHAPQAPVNGPDGSVLGTLVMLPPDRGDDASTLVPFGGAFDLRLLMAAVIAGAVALGLCWALSRRILGPVEALTQAARRLGHGDRAVRVPAKGADEMGELSRAFNTMAEDLAHQESLRRTMVTDVAHELRTPLTNLRGQLEAVEDGLLPASPDTLRSLREEVLHLSRLVEDLQTLSVAEAGRLALDRSALALRDLVEGALEGMQAGAAARGITLRSRIGDLPPVAADPTRIGQVLRNLLTNAVAHTPPGGSIDVSASAEDGGVTVSVADTGPGIAPEHLPYVFDRFYRADPSRARATGGSGLGLAIVKGIVEAHGGSVGVESEPGQGATFRFTLPLAGFITSS